MPHDTEDAGLLDFEFAHLPTRTPEASALRHATRRAQTLAASQAYREAELHNSGAGWSAKVDAKVAAVRAATRVISCRDAGCFCGLTPCAGLLARNNIEGEVRS